MGKGVFLQGGSGAYSELCQTYKMELFPKIVNRSLGRIFLWKYFTAFRRQPNLQKAPS